MIAIMALGHKLAGLIWAAIFVVAIQFVPDHAFAHSGHAHSLMAASSAPSTTTPGIATPSIAEHQAQKARALHIQKLHIRESHAREFDAVGQTLAASDWPDTPMTSPSGGCTGGCCGTGMGCCGIALFDASTILPILKRVAENVPVTFTALSGLDPEALARPPRTIA